LDNFEVHQIINNLIISLALSLPQFISLESCLKFKSANRVN